MHMPFAVHLCAKDGGEAEATAVSWPGDRGRLDGGVLRRRVVDAASRRCEVSGIDASRARGACVLYTEAVAERACAAEVPS